jgi:hypothetical protein
MKLLILHNDADGISPLVLFKYFNIQFDTIISMNYDEYTEYDSLIESLVEQDIITFIDFSPNKKWMEILEKSKCTIIVCDHHGDINTIDSANYLLSNWKYNKFTYYFSPNEKCGTEVYYDNMITDHSNPVINEYIRILSIFDCGKKHDKDYSKATDLNRLFWKLISYGKEGLDKYEYFIKGMNYKFNNPSYGFVFNKLERTKIEEDKKRELEIFNELLSGGKSTIKTRRDTLGRYFCIIKLRSKASGISERLLDKYKKLDYIIIINFYDKENLKVSIRAREGINLPESYDNVRGHPCASGLAEITNDYCENLWSGKIYSLKEKVRKE